MYKGVDDEEEESNIFVKMFLPRFKKELDLKMIANEVAIASQMSNHKNVLKLLGYCLDTELPMLVYELPVQSILSHFLVENDGLPFETKLRIVTYLHHDHLKTFVHRNIHSKQVFLDQDYGAKLFDFQASLPLPEGKTHVDADVIGTKGNNLGQLLWYVYDPADRNDRVDAWKRESETNLLQEKEEKRGQIMECAKLVERCVKQNVDWRPNMVEVLENEMSQQS
ncbi:non-functional pseudokinase ZRK2-like [Humulus lupulus]|uniref:non-functional pseudokinase ZRK2-like n=1 Tax=Humulus lupulus TaxID=3486 RepID=UPI002B414E2A|nr:non-functional pseudokinase ZRK2-like [Humulus lupulus]